MAAGVADAAMTKPTAPLNNAAPVSAAAPVSVIAQLPLVATVAEIEPLVAMLMAADAATAPLPPVVPLVAKTTVDDPVTTWPPLITPDAENCSSGNRMNGPFDSSPLPTSAPLTAAEMDPEPCNAKAEMLENDKDN